MSQPGAPFQLAPLDEYKPAALDPAIWTANMAALAVEHAELANELRCAELPPTWRPALALDGGVTYRLEEPGAAPIWLGQTAAPDTRACNLLGKFDSAGRNPALSFCGTGAEMSYLLGKWPTCVAIYVFETNPLVLAAALRLRDWSQAIRQGRGILIPPGREAAFLAEQLERHSGLLPPGDILLPDLVPAARLQELRGICERAMSESMLRRSQRLSELDATVRAEGSVQVAEAAQPRAALLSLNPHPPMHAIAKALERAARVLGWAVSCRTATGPRDMHPVVHGQALAEFRPELTICVNHPRSRLPMTLPGAVCVWALDETGTAVEPADDVLYLAASPRIAGALREAGVKAEAMLNWYWACEAVTHERHEAKPDPLVILVGDLPDDHPEHYGIEHATHRKLWEHLKGALARTWETPRFLETEKLLVRAERECHADLADATLRQSLIRLIEQVLIPAVVLEQVARAMAGEPLKIRALGRGWGRVEQRNLDVMAESWTEVQDRDATLHPYAAVFAGAREPLSGALLYAAAHGWPLLLHNPGGPALVQALGDVLRPDQHFECFADRSELHRALQSSGRPSSVLQRRVARARRHAVEQHSYVRRLTDLLAHVRQMKTRCRR